MCIIETFALIFQSNIPHSPPLSPSFLHLIDLTAGCGVNVDNKYPTMSINDCIAIHNVTSGSALSPLCVETCLAATLSSLETLLAEYERCGLEELEELYYKYWLHRWGISTHYGEAPPPSCMSIAEG